MSRSSRPTRPGRQPRRRQARGASRVGERFEAVVVDVDHRDETRGVVTVRDPAVEAPVRGSGPLPLGTDVEVELVRSDVVARKVEFRLS